jgi:hypothetical protein
LSERLDIAKRLIEWIGEEGNLKFNETEDSNSNYQVLYEVSDGQTMIFVGIEKKVKRVSIHKRIDLSLDVQNSYKLSPNKEGFWYDLKVRLVFLGVNIIALPNHLTPKIIDLFEYIYFDAFTQDRWIHSIMNIINGYGLCSYMWEQFAISHQSGGTVNGSGQ